MNQPFFQSQGFLGPRMSGGLPPMQQMPSAQMGGGMAPMPYNTGIVPPGMGPPAPQMGGGLPPMAQYPNAHTGGQLPPMPYPFPQGGGMPPYNTGIVPPGMFPHSGGGLPPMHRFHRPFQGPGGP